MEKVSWVQKQINLRPRTRGCHLVTEEILKVIGADIQQFKIGTVHLFLQHTSASLSINENFDSDVRLDMETTLNRIVPEGNKLYRHSSEGADDMPAHVKSSLMGVSLTIPITDGSLNVGTWQGVYLNEHRTGTHQRTMIATINGMPK